MLYYSHCSMRGVIFAYYPSLLCNTKITGGSKGMVEQQVQAENGQVKRFEAIKFPDGKIGIPDYSSMGSHLLIVGNSECINIDTPEVKWMCGKNIKKGLGIKTTYIRGVLFDTRKRRKAFGISKDGKDALIRIEAPIGSIPVSYAGLIL